jgi:hypothetical protein
MAVTVPGIEVQDGREAPGRDAGKRAETAQHHALLRGNAERGLHAGRAQLDGVVEPPDAAQKPERGPEGVVVGGHTHSCAVA